MLDEQIRFDEHLLSLIEQHENDIPDLLGTIANLLSRKTDFFTRFQDSEWEKLLLSVFRGEASKAEKRLQKEKDDAAIRECYFEVTDEAETLQKEIDEKTKNSPTTVSESKSDVVDDDDDPNAGGILKPNAGNECDLQKHKWRQTSKDVEFNIFIRMINGETKCLFVKATYEVRKVLQLIKTTLDEDEDMEVCTISYCSTPLRTDQTLGHYNVKANSTLFLNGRLLGGSVTDAARIIRLQNLFVFVIRGHANHGALSNQLNKLMCCLTEADLKNYDNQHPMHELN